ncbi:protein misato [Ostrinia furnacalis]|uniref:protein misato n=1 Tax=Ostrinia furnacalis TaxID=93504 RepID=UPI001038956E|nr:protein misato [Ostrinia furnacalis]
MATREILTLQFGHYTNYIGAHFWNTQELSFDYTGLKKTEVNHDILYREGENGKGETTYTPRLLLADLKGSLKTLPVSGGLPEESDPDHLEWENVDKVEEPAPQKNQYLVDIDSEGPAAAEKTYNFEEEVKTWTDFIYPRLHSRSVNVIKEYNHGDENEGFDIYNSGTALWKHDFGDTFSDNIRKYVEECDSMQGFQVNFDCIDGFSGMAMGCIEYLADEYTKPIVAYPIIPSYFPDNNPSTQEERDKSNLKDSTRLVNLALSLQALSEHATLFVPLCTSEKGWRKPGNPRSFEYINYNPQLYYHSSALLATAIDTLSQKYRHKSNIHTMSDICADMTGYGRKMAAASLGMPFALNESQYLIDFLNNTTKPIYTSLTPSCKIASDKLFQLITVRGIPESYLKAPLKEAKEQMNLPAYRCNSVKEMFELYFQASNFLSATNVTVCEQPFELKTPYPQFFSKDLNKYGFVASDSSQERIESCAVVAGYHNGNFMADTIEKVHREVSRIQFAKLHKFRQEGLEAADYKESLDKLAEFKDNYEDDFEL